MGATRQRTSDTTLSLLAAALGLSASSASSGMSANMLAQRHWAVAGDVLNAAKPAGRVVAALKGQQVEGRTVALINPRDSTGECQKSVAAVDGPIDVLNLCINSKSGVALLEEAADKGVKQVFIQPGAGSAEIEELAAKRGIQVFNGCVMVELSRL